MAFQFLPLLIAGGLSAGGQIANLYAQNRVQAARDDAMAAERTRMRGFDAQSEAVNERSRQRYEDVEQKGQDKTSELAALYAPSEAPALGVLPQSSSNLVIADETAKRGEARGRSTQEAEALARLQSFGSLFGDIGRGQARDAMDLGMVNSFRRGSQSILPLELEEANSAGNGARLLGSLLSGAGQLATGYALSGAALPSWLGGASAPAMPPIPQGIPSIGSLY